MTTDLAGFSDRRHSAIREELCRKRTRPKTRGWRRCLGVDFFYGDAVRIEQIRVR